MARFKRVIYDYIINGNADKIDKNKGRPQTDVLYEKYTGTAYLLARLAVN